MPTRCSRNRHLSLQLTLLRKKLPETLTSSQRTTVTFWPLRISFARIEARRPRR